VPANTSMKVPSSSAVSFLYIEILGHLIELAKYHKIEI
jgi:hypothetical protein